MDALSKKRLALIITGGSIHSRKGLLNAALCRVKYLQQVADYSIDVYYLQYEHRDFTLSEILLHKNRPRYFDIDGVHIRMIWKIEYQAKRFFRHALKLYYEHTHSTELETFWLSHYVSMFKDYDLISVHSFRGACLARMIQRKYDIAYFATWHGSDIHSMPFTFPHWKPELIDVIENAECNFFVSNKLLETSNQYSNGNKQVLYNGVEERFHRYSDAERQALRQKFDVTNKKVVAFVGSLYPIKNADMLPDIFANVKQKYSGDILFWIIGDGQLRNVVEQKLQELQVECKIFGNRLPSEMPDYYNCVDVLLLPSKNEGLPLVLPEAIACGANAVGSCVGGIPEVVGEKNVFELNDDLIENISSRIAQLLTNHEEQVLQPYFRWEETAKKEDSVYRQYFTKH